MRSFVKRQGRLTLGQGRALEELWPLFGVDYAHGQLDLQTLFGRAAPVTLEIGFGNGENLLEMAAGQPEQNFLGIEVHEPGVGHCLLGVEAQALENIRLLRHDAIEVLTSMLAPAALARVNLFFPDPWPKKRHHKRRIVRRDFVALLATRLATGGVFHVATDWENYAIHIAEIMQQCSEFIALAEPPGDRSVSRFDARGQRLGHSNWEQAWQLLPTPAALA